MKTQTTQPGTAKQKILETAADLFYRQGFISTGIQQIIDEANVSKTTFYAHFKTKEDLGVAYLQYRHSQEISGLKELLSKYKNPYDKYIGFLNEMMGWMKATEFRGCAFANMSSEIIDVKNPMRKEAKYHYEAFRSIIKDVVEDLIKSDKKYQHLDVQHVTDSFLLIAVGAIINSEIYQDTWPFKQAILSVKQLVGEKV